MTYVVIGGTVGFTSDWARFSKINFMIGLVQRSAGAQRSCYIHQMNPVDSRSGRSVMITP